MSPALSRLGAASAQAITPLDPGTAAAAVLARAHEIGACCHAEVNRLEPYRSHADTVAFLRHPPASEPRQYWTASFGEEVVGFAQLAVVAGSPVGEVTILV